MAHPITEQLLRSALSRDIGEEGLASLEAQFEQDSAGELLSDFAQFLLQHFVEGHIDYYEANGALNWLMPLAGFEHAPPRFWEAYVAFEDFETVDAPEEGARHRAQELLTLWAAVS